MIREEFRNKSTNSKKILLAVFVIIVAILFVPPTATGGDNTPDFLEYSSSGNYFKCAIPSGWSVYDPVFGLSEEEKKVYGITLFAPQNRGSLSPEISIYYYAPGNNLHETMKSFIRLHSEPVFGLASDGESYGEVRQTEIAGRKGKIFERIDIRFIGERAIDMPRVSVFEKFIVIPAKADKGFYLLKLSVPDEIKDEYIEIFEKSVKSFIPAI